MIEAEEKSKRTKWMVLDCYFCHKPMQYIRQKRYFDDELNQGVVKSVAECADCHYKVTTTVPYDKALTVVDASCLPTEEQLQAGGY